MARGLFKSAEGVAWSMVGLALLMSVMFYVLHLSSKAPVVGGVADFAAQHSSGAAYGY